MSFLNPAFFLSFLPLSLLIFYLVGAWGGRGGATLVYGLISILFCVPFGWRFLSLTLASVAVNWMVCSALLAEGEAVRARADHRLSDRRHAVRDRPVQEAGVDGASQRRVEPISQRPRWVARYHRVGIDVPG
jgi:hypothetical protein